MTISTNDPISGVYTGTGIVTTFAYDFTISQTSDLQVFQTDGAGTVTILVENTDYTVSGVGDSGNIILTNPLPVGYKLVIRSNRPTSQQTAFTAQSSFLPEIHEDAFDKLTMVTKQNEDIAKRAIRFPSAEGFKSGELPPAVTRANKIPLFDANGDLTLQDNLAAGAPSSISRERFVGNGSLKVFTITVNGGTNGNAAMVYLDGDYQTPAADYTLVGSTLTFTVAPPNLSEIEVVTFNVTDIGTIAATGVTYNNSSSGLTASTAQAAIDEIEGRVDMIEDYAAGKFTWGGFGPVAAGATATYISLTDSGKRDIAHSGVTLTIQEAGLYWLYVESEMVYTSAGATSNYLRIMRNGSELVRSLEVDGYVGLGTRLISLGVPQNLNVGDTLQVNCYNTAHSATLTGRFTIFKHSAQI